MTNRERILAVRKSTGLSQRRFGLRFGIPCRTVESWESGDRACPPYVVEMLEALAKTDFGLERLGPGEESH